MTNTKFSDNGWPSRKFNTPKNMGANGYEKEKNLKNYSNTGLGKDIFINASAGSMFFSMSGYIFARYGYHLKLSENGGFRSLESQINSFNEKYSNVPQEINKFIINANKYDATKYLSEDSTFRDNITKPENKLVISFNEKENGKCEGYNRFLIVDGGFRGVPPWSSLDARVKAFHQKSYPGTNFLANGYIKYWFKMQYEGGPNKGKVIPGSGNWYYKKVVQSPNKDGLTEYTGGRAEGSTPKGSVHGWGLAVDLAGSTIAQLEGDRNVDPSTGLRAIDWLKNNMESYGWSKCTGFTSTTDVYHLIYFGEISNSVTSLSLKPATITTSKTATAKTTTQKFNPLQPLTITPKVMPTGPGNSIHLVKTIDAIIAPPVAYNIGQTGPGGGRIFITPSTPGNTTGRYFEVAPKNWYDGSKSPYLKAAWRNDGPTVKWAVGVGTTAVEIGRGYQNTLAIAARHAVSAAAYCRSYRGGGKTDWFLPSKNELNQIYISRKNIGGFLNEVYWSSTEANTDYASSRDFLTGVANINSKTDKNHVLPVRSFPPTEVIPPGATPNYSIVSTYIPAIVTDSKSNNFLQHLQTLIESSPDLALDALNNYVSSDISQTAIDIQIDLLKKASKVGTKVFKFLTDVGIGVLLKDFNKHYYQDPSITAPVTVPIDGGGSSSRVVKLASFESQTLPSIPSISNLQDLSPKVFQVAEPYRGSSDIGGFLTHDQFFNMLIHPKVGNFGPALAAILTAIASRETGKLGLGTPENPDPRLGIIPIGLANGSSHLGFLQFRCRPQNLDDDTKSYSKAAGWISSSLYWYSPYNVDGELGSMNPILSKRYSWEAFIEDQKTIKKIKDILKPDPSGKTFKKLNKNEISSVKNLFHKNMPQVEYRVVDGKKEEFYSAEDRVESSALVVDWARIPANQILMLKSKFGLAPKFFQNNNNPVNFPYLSQSGLEVMTKKQALNLPEDYFLLKHFNMRDGKWTTGVEYSTARNVLARNASKVDPLNVMSYDQAINWANNQLADFALCLNSSRKALYNLWRT